MQTLILGVPVPRWLVAGAGLGFFAIGLTGAGSASEFGHCLQAAASVGHCGWCYAAVAAFLVAASPWPTALQARAR